MNLKNAPGIKYIYGNRRHGYWIIVLLIFVFGSAASIVYWHFSDSQSYNSQIAKYKQNLNASKSIVVDRLNEYALLLDDGTSLLSIDNYNVPQTNWLDFFKTYNLTNSYPGVIAVSFSRYLTQSSLPAYISYMQTNGYPNFSIVPAGNRNSYAPVTDIGYVYPGSLSALGYDELSNPITANAMQRAMTEDITTVSRLVKTVAVQKDQYSFQIIKPVYDGPSKTASQREGSIYGFVFVVVNANQFFNSLFSRYLSPNLAIQVFDQRVSPKNRLYSSPKYTYTTQHMQHPLISVLAVNFGGHTWDIRLVNSKNTILAGVDQMANIILVVGLSLSFIAAVVVWSIIYYREQNIYWEKQAELQAAKDDLLSLASHQLRTPATIVKQYLGILLQNYAGEITKEQRKIIKTAYDNNEHQLEIANQFLNAARLGSGRISLNRQRLSLNDLIKRVVTEQKQAAGKRSQQLIVKQPKRPIYIQADPKYLPIVVENLINNAIVQFSYLFGQE